MRAPHILFAGCVALLGALACDPPPPPEDAGADGGEDAGSQTDAGPPVMCDPDCSVGQTCCPDPAGGGDNTCYALRSDPRHCGNCNVDCIVSNRGDGCEASQCTCGPELLGCLGTRGSHCCPARPDESDPYCANLERDATNCGDCNVVCDVREADRCDGGRCFCGDDGERCLGTPESTCCQEGADIECANLRTSRFHCGGCNIFCQGGETCEDGVCTRGATCDEVCSGVDICCNGSCCTRARCFNDVCGGIPDGGPSDAGPDAGPFDAGAVDAGPADAGPADAGTDAGAVDSGADAG